ncbi:MAG: transglycosylase SLT domain-containing protein [Methylovulum sp.]|nr:transglycosylase SLT domain-containing protein [Methylovulum sp.]
MTYYIAASIQVWNFRGAVIRHGILNSWYGVLWIAGLMVLSSAVFGNVQEQQRQDFLRAESLLEQGNEAAFLDLSRTLTSYPLYPYLQYQWLKNNLHQTDKVQFFLLRYKDSRYAGLLRDKWLAYLADHDRWHEFVRYYEASGDITLECQFYWGLYNTGNKQQALGEAKRLWTVGYEQPKACDPLFFALTLSPYFTRELIWQRFELALKKDNVTLAGYIHRFLGKADQNSADVWLQVHKKPLLIKDDGFRIGKAAQTGRIFAYGVGRVAKSDLDLAIQIWDGRKHEFTIDQQTAQDVDRTLALALAFQQDSRAYHRLNQLLLVDDIVREWKTRAALLERNWQHVADALAGLTAQQQQEPGWQYWLARSLEAAGNRMAAQTIYQKLALDRSYYGFLAADVVEKPYNLADKPVPLSAYQLEALAQETDFKVVREFNALDRDLEARRQWWYAINKLPKQQLMIAAKLAQLWQWDQQAIITLVKADYWDDLGLRFPIRYLAEVRRNAYRQALNPAIIFGLIRQESMLDKQAVSPAGARGLMQVMPATSRQIAHEMNEALPSDVGLFNPDVNIRQGSYFFKKLLNQFNGHFALAIAAYNAGPYRVMKWLPVDRDVPADIWIETVPYKETRKYIASVFSYAIIYQQALQLMDLQPTDLTQTLKMKNLLHDVPHR